MFGEPGKRDAAAPTEEEMRPHGGRGLEQVSKNILVNMAGCSNVNMAGVCFYTL